MEQQTQRQLFLLLSFKGTNYHGFQVQENAVTIASTVQDAVEKVFHKRLDIKGCSRTDAGVHANAFGLTLKTDQAIPCDALVRAMNVNLPADIAVFDCYEEYCFILCHRKRFSLQYGADHGRDTAFSRPGKAGLCRHCKDY